jgi:neutral ceramidase
MGAIRSRGAGGVLMLLLALFAPGIAWGQSGALRVGAARVEIPPPADPTNPPSSYAHGRLYVRAIVLDDGVTRAALIGADQGGMSEAVWSAAAPQIASELNIPVENVLMSVTHTHSAGFGPPRPSGASAPAPVGGGGAPAAQAAPPLAAQMLQAVRQANSRLRAARFGFGTGMSWLNVNRDAIDPDTRRWTQAPNLEGPSDKTVAVLKFESLSGEPIAVYVNYAMHPVNGYLSGFTSADFPGAASRYIEQAFGEDMVAVWVQGASGDQNPLSLRASTNVMASRGGLPITGEVLVRESVEAPLRDGLVPARAADPKVRDVLERWIESQGHVLGEEVIRVMTNTTHLDAGPRIRAAQKMVTCPGRRRTDTGREGSPGTYVDGDPVNLRLGVLSIGSTALTSVNAEIYSRIAQRLKAESPLANTVMVTLANGSAGSGYVPDDQAFGRHTFQVLGSRLKPGCAETAIVNGLIDLIGGSR